MQFPSTKNDSQTRHHNVKALEAGTLGRAPQQHPASMDLGAAGKAQLLN